MKLFWCINLLRVLLCLVGGGGGQSGCRGQWPNSCGCLSGWASTKNLGKSSSVTFTPGFIWNQLVKDAYKRQAKGEGATFWKWKRTRVSHNECGQNDDRILTEEWYGENPREDCGTDKGSWHQWRGSYTWVLTSVAFPVGGVPGEEPYFGQDKVTLYV